MLYPDPKNIVLVQCALEKAVDLIERIQSWSARRIKLGKADSGIINIHLDCQKTLKAIDKKLKSFWGNQNYGRQ